MAVLTSRKGEGRGEKRSQADCTSSQSAGKKSRGEEKKSRGWCGAREGGMPVRLGWGAASSASQPPGLRCGQLAAASREETKRHLPNIAPTVHLPIERCRYPKHVFSSELSLIQADPLPAGTGADLPQGKGCAPGWVPRGAQPKFPVGYTSRPAAPHCNGKGELAAMQCISTPRSGGRKVALGHLSLGKAAWVPFCLCHVGGWSRCTEKRCLRTWLLGDQILPTIVRTRGLFWF